MRAIERVAARHHLAIVEDACQAHFATSDARPIATIGVAGAFSFYPTKNLGALGDGGAIVTNDGALAARVKRLETEGRLRGITTRIRASIRALMRSGGNSRARLPFLTEWTDRRRLIARSYRSSIVSSRLDIPAEFDAGHVYHLFAVLCTERADLQAHLTRGGGDAHPLPCSNPASTRPRRDAPSKMSDRRPNLRGSSVAADISVIGGRGGRTGGGGRQLVPTISPPPALY